MLDGRPNLKLKPRKLGMIEPYSSHLEVNVSGRRGSVTMPISLEDNLYDVGEYFPLQFCYYSLSVQFRLLLM